MKILINYANPHFYYIRKCSNITAMEVGEIDKIISYSPEDINKDFSRRYKRILKAYRGSGYWLWKPYFIKKTLEQIEAEDVLVYADAATFFVHSIDPLIDVLNETKQGALIFGNLFIEKEWTKRDAFILMDCDAPQYANTNQAVGGFSLWRKTAFSMQIVDEWLNYAQDERIITDIPNRCGKPNYPNFKQHRHDQSIISLLAKKHQLAIHRCPSWRTTTHPRYPHSRYPKIVDFTRMRQDPSEMLMRIVLPAWRQNFYHYSTHYPKRIFQRICAKIIPKP